MQEPQNEHFVRDFLQFSNFVASKSTFSYEFSHEPPNLLPQNRCFVRAFLAGVKRGYATFETSTYGPHVTARRRLRTVADGCERKRNVERTHPQPPNPQSETGTLATHSGIKCHHSVRVPYAQYPHVRPSWQASTFFLRSGPVLSDEIWFETTLKHNLSLRPLCLGQKICSKVLPRFKGQSAAEKSVCLQQVEISYNRHLV